MKKKKNEEEWGKWKGLNGEFFYIGWNRLKK